MAQLLSRLERDGMIKRSPDPSDGRSTLISITGKALAVLPQIDAAIDAGNELALAGMSDSEIKLLIDLLQRMIANLEGAAQSEQVARDRSGKFWIDTRGTAQPREMPMTSAQVSGTEGYADEAEELFKRYEAIPAADAHRAVLHLIPTAPSRILDIGSGTGRDAAWFAANGHRVVAIEPTDALRLPAMALHPSPHIEWLNDSLPELVLLRTRGESFDVVMLTAVWMHLDAQQRQRAMPNVASLVREGGTMIMKIRHGPVPAGRRMFEVTPEETIELARMQGLHPVLNLRTESSQEANRAAGVDWTSLAFVKGKNPQRPKRGL
jgi:SAM-dependent methyltransferase